MAVLQDIRALLTWCICLLSGCKQKAQHKQAVPPGEALPSYASFQCNIHSQEVTRAR